MLWAFLLPKKILHEPSVLTKKKADFRILSTQGIFYLIEIEKPQTQLIKRDGGFHAELQKGIDQVRDWSIVVGDHRNALLSELGLSQGVVREIRYILVAGS